jgi:hemerythrin-like domain-containing protein
MATMKKAKSTSEASDGGRDATAVLEEDHAEARKLLSALAESSERAVHTRETMLEKLAPALWIHMQIEEEIFYPSFARASKNADDEVAVFEARAEHEGAKAALAKLERAEVGTPRFRALAKVVRDLIDHHATEEEEEMFPRARKLLGEEQLQGLGAQLTARKEELKESGDFRRGVSGSESVSAEADEEEEELEAEEAESEQARH